MDTDIECSAPTLEITTSKMQLNSMIYTPEAHFMTMDIKNYYIGTLFEDPKNTNISASPSI